MDLASAPDPLLDRLNAARVIVVIRESLAWRAAARVGLVVSAMVMAGLVTGPWYGPLTLGLAGAGSVMADFPWRGRPGKPAAWWVALSWGASAGGLVLGHWRPWESYYAVIAWLMGAGMLRWSGLEKQQSGWTALAGLWIAFGEWEWLAAAYFQNSEIRFYFGLGLTLVFLVASKRMLRLPDWGLIAANTLILLALALPIAEALRSVSGSRSRPVSPQDRLYLFRNARRDPAGFRRWCIEEDAAFAGMLRTNFTYDSAGRMRLHPKPGTESRLFGSRVVINSHGFRGKEIATEKGNRYRIIALGESTTFGFTYDAIDKPWPEVLEEMIQKLQPSREVEVINTGIPDCNLRGNLARLADEILPLKPDMIISYHGYNGFGFLKGVVPLSSALDPPVHKPRPLKLLGDAEYSIKLRLAKRREERLLALSRSRFNDPSGSEYAHLYEELIRVAQSNHIRLVIANFSMAVNSGSNFALIDFYRQRFPGAVYWIKANEAHSALLERLAEKNPQVRFVDTHPALDGQNDKFIDLIHLTQEGREQIARNMFAGMKDLLAKDLGKGEVEQGSGIAITPVLSRRVFRAGRSPGDL